MLKPGPPESGVSETMVATCSGGGSRSMTLLTSMQRLPPQMIPLRSIISAELEDRLGNLQIVLDRPLRPQALLSQFAVIGADRLLRTHRTRGDLAHQRHDGQGRFREVDLAAEQGDARAVL